MDWKEAKVIGVQLLEKGEDPYKTLGMKLEVELQGGLIIPIVFILVYWQETDLGDGLALKERNRLFEHMNLTRFHSFLKACGIDDWGEFTDGQELIGYRFEYAKGDRMDRFRRLKVKLLN